MAGAAWQAPPHLHDAPFWVAAPQRAVEREAARWRNGAAGARAGVRSGRRGLSEQEGRASERAGGLAVSLIAATCLRPAALRTAGAPAS